MSAYLEAWSLLERHGYLPAAEFDAYMCDGFVYVEQDCVILARWSAPGTLFVFLAVGARRLQRFCEIAPAGLVFVEFARGLRGAQHCKRYSFERLSRLCETIAAPSTSSNSLAATSAASRPAPRPFPLPFRQ